MAPPKAATAIASGTFGTSPNPVNVTPASPTTFAPPPPSTPGGLSFACSSIASSPNTWKDRKFNEKELAWVTKERKAAHIQRDHLVEDLSTSRSILKYEQEEERRVLEAVDKSRAAGNLLRSACEELEKGHKRATDHLELVKMDISHMTKQMETFKEELASLDNQYGLTKMARVLLLQQLTCAQKDVQVLRNKSGATRKEMHKHALDLQTAEKELSFLRATLADEDLERDRLLQSLSASQEERDQLRLAKKTGQLQKQALETQIVRMGAEQAQILQEQDHRRQQIRETEARVGTMLAQKQEHVAKLKVSIAASKHVAEVNKAHRMAVDYIQLQTRTIQEATNVDLQSSLGDPLSAEPSALSMDSPQSSLRPNIDLRIAPSSPSPPLCSVNEGKLFRGLEESASVLSRSLEKSGPLAAAGGQVGSRSSSLALKQPAGAGNKRPSGAAGGAEKSGLSTPRRQPELNKPGNEPSTSSTRMSTANSLQRKP